MGALENGRSVNAGNYGSTGEKEISTLTLISTSDDKRPVRNLNIIESKSSFLNLYLCHPFNGQSIKRNIVRPLLYVDNIFIMIIMRKTKGQMISSASSSLRR